MFLFMLVSVLVVCFRLVFLSCCIYNRKDIYKNRINKTEELELT